MLRKLVAVAALSAAVAVVPAGAVSAEPYPPQVPTETTITAKVKGPGKPVILTVDVSADFETQPTGTLEIQVTDPGASKVAARAGAPLFTATVRFEGDPVKLTGPSLPKGSYAASADFTPDDAATFLPSDDTTTFRVGSGGDTGGETDDNGTLPNTGGPHLMWLLLGTGLVAAGAGGVGYSRRRTPSLA